LIEIAGDMLEGGGQIVRTAVALSALTNKEVRITKIRDNRPNPGLQAQHVTAVRAVAAAAGAETEGLFTGSRELVFKPHGHVAGEFSFNVGTAGSVPLILQAVMPSAAYAPGQVEFELIGGTDVPWSPTVDYVRIVELPVLQLMGYRATLTVHQRGHYPKGGGRVTMLINPPRILRAVNLVERGVLTGANGISHCVKLPSHVAQRQAAAAKEKLGVRGIREVNIIIESYPSTQDPHLGPGSGIALAMKFANGPIIGADSIGEKGKPAERVGDEAASKLLKEFDSKAALDRHMGDIIIPYMAVAEGRSEIEVSAITTHTLTNIKVSEILAGVEFRVEGSLNDRGRISVEGIGLKA
jgi:RNA 3'-terminal phosphate cyclase (ATP)